MSTVLVVDDDRDIRELVVFKLNQAGLEVMTAENGPDALATVSLLCPDVAVLDVMMPGMSGLEVARLLRADPATHSVGILLLTARVQEADVVAGFGCGADDYVTKPFSPRLLLHRVEALLARQTR